MDPDEGQCLARITALPIRFEILPKIAEGACGATQPLKVIALTDEVAVSPPATMICAMAEALAEWNKSVVVPEARALGVAPKAIAIGTSYQCRTRNHQAGAKLSEHAFANAVDLAGIEFKDRPAITVGKTAAGSPEERFANAIRQGACKSFTTVLGPGSDAAHADHLHLDLRGRRGGYRICQ